MIWLWSQFGCYVFNKYKEAKIVIQIDLTKDEQRELAFVLENILGELRMEIAHTDRMDFRDILKNRKRVVRKLLDTLEKE